MKKKILTFFLSIGIYALNAQTIVSTTPENKKVFLEEFTGTGCPNCPAGHTIAANLLNSNPDVLFVIANHPNNSSYTSGDPMAKAFPAAFYMTPFISPSNRYMPSAMINRRVWGSERIVDRANWGSHVNTIKAEASPLNVGVSSTYNSSTKVLTVNVEVYFTSNVTSSLTIYAELTESGIVASQSGGSSSYIHNHVFREAFVSQWGNTIASPTTQGTLKTFTYTFNNTSANYNMTNCEVIAFVRNANNEEIISGNGAPVGQSTVHINETNQNENIVSVFPNPFCENTNLNILISEPGHVEYTVSNVLGQELYYKNMGIISSGNYSIPLDRNIFTNSKGLHFLNIRIGQDNYVKKIIIE